MVNYGKSHIWRLTGAVMPRNVLEQLLVWLNILGGEHTQCDGTYLEGSVNKTTDETKLRKLTDEKRKRESTGDIERRVRLRKLNR